MSNIRVVVIGGGSGMGRSTARLLAAKDGFDVAIGGRTLEKLAEAAEGTSIRTHAIDVADRASVNEYFQWAESELGGPIDVMVNAAGINIPDRSMQQMSPEQWDQMIAVNLTGAYNCMHAVLSDMRSRKDGLIINISSVAGKRAIALAGVAYSASKFGMTALGTCVSNEAADDGVRVTNVYPGEVDTPLLKQRPTPVTEEHRGRMLQADHVGELVVSLIELPREVHVPEVVVKPLTQEWC
ncbi:SDR family oxidoreductase [Mariniblastus fucicola]|uniref:Putative oxidoreductase n=1 Tax=Mariniblastus fucicola TaxID=980251 RepID=A0A5B9PDE4_9BACT|nr:SDR family oxidoreductase [Mariniblastus fucicola]QEG23215.1 putative oxidoreductase [Mariniblastus fucicola]